ncbi:MAG: NAD(P)/FAD-dependent oxidoreductase [Anaerolineales bacterium]|nr:NAD(P)/FAD-dependent oxidoreductase [Anaerolineales bacterium]
MQYDVVIIGAGLAGLSAAEVLSTASELSVALFEKRHVGSNRTTPMTFVDVVERFGLQESVQGTYNRFTFDSPLGNKSSHPFDGNPLVALHYRKACEILQERALAGGNLSLLKDNVTGIKRGREGGWKLSTGSGERIQTPLVIDASGKAMLTSRWLDLPRPTMYSHSFGQLLKNCPVPDPEEVYFLAPSDDYGDGGGWIYPLDDGLVSFGYATLGDNVAFPGKLAKARYDAAFREFEPYANWFKDAEVVHNEAGSIPICPPNRMVNDGVMRVGDAAGLATIWSCMGSEPALLSGKLAGEAAIIAHSQNDFSTKTLNHYQSGWDADYKRIYQQGKWLAVPSWGQSAESWNSQIPRVQDLTSEQMLMRLRTNWPQLPWWQIFLLAGYDLLGRTRRGIVEKLRALMKEKDTVE